MVRKPRCEQPLLGCRADAVNESDRLVRQHGARLVLIERGKAARLVQVGGDLGQELVAGQADRNRDADVALDLAGKPRQHFGRDHAVHALGAGEVEKRLVDRQRLDQRRQRLHGMAHLAADPDIFRHVGPDHGGMRAQRQRLEHRHRRAHPEGAGDVAGRRHHAALAAADDDGLVGDLRIVALLDGGVERVAIDVGERQRGQRVVTDQARGAACAASPAPRSRDRRGNPGKSRSVRRALARLAVTARRAPSAGRSAPGAPRQCWWGAAARRSANAFTVASSRSTKSSTLARNCGSAAAVRRVSGPIPDLGQEQAQPLGVAGDEGKRLNRNDFSHFPGVVNRLFQLMLFAFP